MSVCRSPGRFGSVRSCRGRSGPRRRQSMVSGPGWPGSCVTRWAEEMSRGRDAGSASGPSGDLPELLVGQPCDSDFPGRVAGFEMLVEPGGLLVGELLDPGHQGAAEPIERIVLLSASVQGLLLDPAADPVEGLRAELDDVERVQHSEASGSPLADRVRVTAERVECGILDLHGELQSLLGHPGRVGGSGAAGPGVEKPCLHASLLITGQIHHALMG